MSGRIEHGPSRVKAVSSSGDPGFVGLAFEQLRAGLHRYLLRRLQRTEDIEDLIQEVYMRLLRFTHGETVRFPEAYVFRVALNVLCEFRMHKNRLPVVFDSEAAADAAEHLVDESASPDEACEQLRREHQLKGLITQLPRMQRVVLLMATRENLSHTQIANKLGITASTARVHLYRAICRLRDQI